MAESVPSCQGRTRAYAKSGVMVREFPSMLPGGNHQIRQRGFALLDCIWSEVNKTYYVLDLIMWLNQSILESEVKSFCGCYIFSNNKVNINGSQFRNIMK